MMASRESVAGGSWKASGFSMKIDGVSSSRQEAKERRMRAEGYWTISSVTVSAVESQSSEEHSDRKS
jgi:hypothetical protein